MKTRLNSLFLPLILLCSTMAIAPAQSIPSLAVLKGPSGIALVNLFDQPPLLPSGKKLAIVALPSADIMAAKVISGEYAAAVLPINMAAKLHSSGIPLVLGAVIGNGMLSLLTNEPGLKSLADLRGATLNVAGQGATPEFLIRRLLKDAGLDPDREVSLAFALSYPEMAAALASGKIQTALLPEPFATLARMQNPKLLSPIDITDLWRRSTGMRDFPMTALVFRSDGRLSHSDIRAILDAAQASIIAVVKNPSEAGRLAEKYDLGLRADVARASIPRCNFVFERSSEARYPIEALLREFLAISPVSIGNRLPEGDFYEDF